jgi:hypothetical protein
LENDFKRDFWWLNNGITIIATDFSQHGKTLYLDDLQIVNGLQTSFVIDKYFKSNESTEIKNPTLKGGVCYGLHFGPHSRFS